MSRASSRRLASEFEKGAHGLRRNREAAGAVAAEDRGHRREQRRRPRRAAEIGAAVAVNPGDFRKQPDHPRERQHDPDQKHQGDQAVEPRIGIEGVEDLLLQHETDQAAQNQKHQHPEQEDAGRGKFDLFEIVRHRRCLAPPYWMQGSASSRPFPDKRKSG